MQSKHIALRTTPAGTRNVAATTYRRKAIPLDTVTGQYNVQRERTNHYEPNCAPPQDKMDMASKVNLQSTTYVGRAKVPNLSDQIERLFIVAAIHDEAPKLSVHKRRQHKVSTVR